MRAALLVSQGGFNALSPPEPQLMSHHRKPSREETWSPTILGMQKRDLLKDVVGIFGEYGASEDTVQSN